MSEVTVRVALRIRPLLPKEVVQQHQVCVRVVPDSEQVLLGSDRLFTFDHAFGPTATQDEVYESCVQRLLESLVEGYNATVFCYGQTGSGKTYTLGGGHQDEEGGIVDRAVQDLFSLLEKTKQSDGVEAKVTVSYMELYKEELRDLLELSTNHKDLHIREDENGNTVVVGAREVVITSAEELLNVLEMGNALRHTGPTGMNEHSSRSHAVLTLKVNICSNNNTVRSSKLCLVDLAGSERAGKTGNTGTRLKESIQINTGLLALGNVIRALSEQGRNRRGNRYSSAHIPYRDAKITRLLRDSLGGNAHTLMVACVSPSHHFVAETLNVLQFASRARHIRNCPGAALPQRNVNTCPINWPPAETRLEELQCEVQTLKGLLINKEKDAEVKRELAASKSGEEDCRHQSSLSGLCESDSKMNNVTAWQLFHLSKEAAALLGEVCGTYLSSSFRQRLQEWRERLRAVSQSHQEHDPDISEGIRDQGQLAALSEVKHELHKCQEALCVKGQLLEQKEVQLKQKQEEVEKLLLEKTTHLLALDKEKEQNRLQTEQLLHQQILIDRFRSNHINCLGAASGGVLDSKTSWNLCQRPHSVPTITQICQSKHPRKIHSSPPSVSLERVMAAFKMRGQLLLAETEQKDHVYCAAMNQQAESKALDEEVEEEWEEQQAVRHSLNRTWTSQQKKLQIKEKNTGINVSNENTIIMPLTEGTKEMQTMQRSRIKLKRANITERRIHELTVNIQMKEELIRELDKSEMETRAVENRSGQTGGSIEGGLLARLSVHNQQVRAEAYHSLQRMRQEREKLQSSLGQLKDTRDRRVLQTQPDQRSWLEKEEEHILQKRAELQELEEELRSREEVLQHRKACLKQKKQLEIKKLHSSQVLSQDFLDVSMKLECVEKQLQSSGGGGVTLEELEKDRALLLMKRDILDAQLRDNRVLTAEEEHYLLQLEEAIEALDAALEFKNQTVQEKKEQLSVNDSSLQQSKSYEPAQHCDVIRKLKNLCLPEAIELLIKYFNKVVCLHEAERRMALRCEELELHNTEQEAALKEMKAAMQRLALDTDRKLTQQHRDHQNNIQLLLQNIKEGVSGDAQQAKETRLRHLEKELFFYKSTSRQLKKKLKEILGDSLTSDSQASHIKEQSQTYSVSTNKHQTHSAEVQQTTPITTRFQKVYTEKTANALKGQTESLSSDCQGSQKFKMTQCNQEQHLHSAGSSTKGYPEELLEMNPGRLCRRDFQRIPPEDLQLISSATRGQQSSVQTSTESTLEDSIEIPRSNER